MAAAVGWVLTTADANSPFGDAGAGGAGCWGVCADAANDAAHQRFDDQEFCAVADSRCEAHGMLLQPRPLRLGRLLGRAALIRAWRTACSPGIWEKRSVTRGRGRVW
jgi:hypothetical protein